MQCRGQQKLPVSLAIVQFASIIQISHILLCYWFIDLKIPQAATSKSNFTQQHFFNTLDCDLLRFLHNLTSPHPVSVIKHCLYLSSTSKNKVIPWPSTGLCSVLFPTAPPFAPHWSQRALAAGDTKLPALPPPQIPSCLSKYPPHSQSVWHSDRECDRGCTCVRPYVCVCVCDRHRRVWQEVNNRNTHFHLISTSPQCQLATGWWCWIQVICQNFYAQETLCSLFMQVSTDLYVTVWLQELLG